MAAQRIQFDKDLCGSAVLQFLDGPSIDFQFPPRVTSDSRKASWEEKDLPSGDTVAVWKTAGPREITLALTYIVEGGEGKEAWTTQKISRIVRDIRGYFPRAGSKLNDRLTVVNFKLWRIGDQDRPMTCRIKGVDIKHSDTIVTSCSSYGTGVSNAYPLKTDITIDMAIWSLGLENVQTSQDLFGLTHSNPEWY